MLGLNRLCDSISFIAKASVHIAVVSMNGNLECLGGISPPPRDDLGGKTAHARLESYWDLFLAQRVMSVLA